MKSILVHAISEKYEPLMPSNPPHTFEDTQVPRNEGDLRGKEYNQSVIPTLASGSDGVLLIIKNQGLFFAHNIRGKDELRVPYCSFDDTTPTGCDG